MEVGNFSTPDWLRMKSYLVLNPSNRRPLLAQFDLHRLQSSTRPPTGLPNPPSQGNRWHKISRLLLLLRQLIARMKDTKILDPFTSGHPLYTFFPVFRCIVLPICSWLLITNSLSLTKVELTPQALSFLVSSLCFLSNRLSRHSLCFTFGFCKYRSPLHRL